MTVFISENLFVNGNIHHALFESINDKENISNNINKSCKNIYNSYDKHYNQSYLVSFCRIYDTFINGDVYESYIFIIQIMKRGERSIIRVLLDIDMTITPTVVVLDSNSNHSNGKQIVLRRKDNKYIQLSFNTNNNKTSIHKWHKILCESLANITLEHCFRLIKVQDEINTKLLFNTIKVCSKLVGKDYPGLRRARNLIAMKQQIHVGYSIYYVIVYMYHCF